MEEYIKSRSAIMRRLYDEVERAAGSDVSIILQGETGTGKNALARYVHSHSPRRSGAFLPLDCAELNRSLLESELFGREKGAFTGATQLKPGLLELASGGTLFLDEVENLDQYMQAKLLGVLDEKRFRRVGGRKLLETDLRIISAANTDIKARMQAGVFREDLYYRLQGLVVTIPPLRARPEDIRVFTRHILNVLSERYRKRITVSPEAMSCLLNYHWPGNIRELARRLETIVISRDVTRIELRHIPMDLQRSDILTTAEEERWTLDAVANAYVARILELTSNNLTRASEILGVCVNTVKKKRKKLDGE